MGEALLRTLLAWCAEHDVVRVQLYAVDEARSLYERVGFAPPSDDGPVTLFFRVDDIEPYAAKVVELGGQVLSRSQYDSGGNAACVDDQGLRFDLFQPAPGY